MPALKTPFSSTDQTPGSDCQAIDGLATGLPEASSTSTVKRCVVLGSNVTWEGSTTTLSGRGGEPGVGLRVGGGFGIRVVDAVGTTNVLRESAGAAVGVGAGKEVGLAAGVNAGVGVTGATEAVGVRATVAPETTRAAGGCDGVGVSVEVEATRAAGITVGDVAAVGTGAPVGLTTAAWISSLPCPPNPITANTTPAIATAPTTASPIITGTTGKRLSLVASGTLSTCRWATAPSFSMKNCSCPGVPVNCPWGERTG